MTLFLSKCAARVAFVSPFCIGSLASACGSPAQKIEKHLAEICAPISATLAHSLLLLAFLSVVHVVVQLLSLGTTPEVVKAYTAQEELKPMKRHCG